MRRIPNTFPKYQLSLTPSFTKCFILLPTTCLLGMNLLSMNLLKLQAETSTKQETATIIVKAERKDVIELMERIATKIREDNLDDASVRVDKAIQISEDNNFVEFLPQLYDYLVIIKLREGKNDLAEEILVRSVERLTEIGYKEADNEILRLQLILCRLYQVRGE